MKETLNPLSNPEVINSTADQIEDISNTAVDNLVAVEDEVNDQLSSSSSQNSDIDTESSMPMEEEEEIDDAKEESIIPRSLSRISEEESEADSVSAQVGHHDNDEPLTPTNMLNHLEQEADVNTSSTTAIVSGVSMMTLNNSNSELDDQEITQPTENNQQDASLELSAAEATQDDANLDSQNSATPAAEATNPESSAQQASIFAIILANILMIFNIIQAFTSAFGNGSDNNFSSEEEAAPLTVEASQVNDDSSQNTTMPTNNLAGLDLITPTIADTEAASI